ncbi:hypothetical protein CK203_088512 [Vitis vinifera]|uniref:Transposase-associated domain-containing protein n=1 Tax=Vitis vinifera TaxID=29760 RepID=A0A438EZX3_VITVI|nr:hypothetical protein CK203_088512 [Vitis vinifera]
MDRSWMSKDRMSREYEEGVEYFINFALEHCPNQRGIRCPCMRCGNLIHHTPNKIREHMFFNGIDQSYCTWYWHGEAGPTSSQPTEMAQRYDTMDCGDVASTVEMVHAIEDEFMTDPMSFKKLLEDAEKPLYPSCIKFTKLSALVKLYNVKARYGWSDKSFSDLLQILGDMLPVNNEMPLSMYEAKKTLNALGMEYKKIHACPNDCILYRNELNEASSCPTCGMSRWKVNKAGARNTKRIPAKVLWYFPPIPRNLRLTISADGINPHSSMTRPRQPGKDIDVYLAPLVDDLKTLWEVGVKAYDAHQQEFFTLKAILLWTINDSLHMETCLGKTKDGVKSRLDLLEMGLRPDLTPRFGLKRTYLPPACYTLSRKEKKIVLQTLADLKVVDVSRLNDIQQDIVVTLCLLEKYFPPSIFDIMLHLTVHLVHESLKSYVRNHNRPEGCIAECYIAEEALEFCTEYLSGMDAIGIPSSMKDEWKCGKPLLGGRAIIFMIINCEHMKYLKTKYPRQSKRVKWLEDEHVRTFSHWLRKKVSDDISKKEPIEKELKWLAQGPRQQVLTYPGYIIHGCRYHIKNVMRHESTKIVVLVLWHRPCKLQVPKIRILCLCDWVDSKNGVKVDELGFTLVDLSKIGHKSDPFILATQLNKFFM